MNFIFLFIKSIVIGFFMLVPGISGGSIAILLNIYDDLLASLNSIFKTFKSSFAFLAVATIGGVIGLFLSTFVLEFIIEHFFFEMMFLFMGLMLSYSFSLFKCLTKKSIFKSIVLIFVGVILGILLTKIPVGIFNISNRYLNLFVLGLFLAIALILPGISVSYVLLIFSMYDKLLLAIKELNVIYLLEISAALAIGILLVSKMLNYLLVYKKTIVENIIVGFIFSSIWIVLPVVKTEKELICAIIFISVGVIVKNIFNIYKR